jgi:hypothetical protein
VVWLLDTAVGYYSVWFVWGFLVVLLPLSYPISKILDLLLGREIGTVYSKEEVCTPNSSLLRLLLLNKRAIDDIATVMWCSSKNCSIFMQALAKP